MKTLAIGLVLASLSFAPCAAIAQESKPLHPVTPAFDPSQPREPGAKEKPKLYDEQADARVQIRAAVAKAKKENRRVLIQWGGNWCGWCIMMHDTMTKDSKLARKIQYEYDVVHVDAGRDNKNMDLAKELGAECKSFPYLTILDSDGKPVTHSNTEPFENADQEKARGHDAAKLLAFLTEHQAPYLEAKGILEQGLSEAKRSGKRVFLHFGAPWCGWCHRLEDWMAREDISPLLTKEFVDVKIDVDRTVGGKEMLERYSKGKSGGIPWFVFLDAEGKAIVDSNAADGNVGFPAQPNEIAHFGAMLEKAAKKLTKGEIATIKGSLTKKEGAGH